MANTIFRKVTFICSGCGKSEEVKAQVSTEHARTPIGLPTGWGTMDVVGQRTEDGLLMVLAIPVCSEACGQKALAGDGVPAIASRVSDMQAVFNDKGRVVSKDGPRLVTPPT